jgi:hypothetical protein
VRDEAPAANTQPSTPITTQQQQPTMAAAAAAVASGAMTPNGDIDYKKVNKTRERKNHEPQREREKKTNLIESNAIYQRIYLFIVTSIPVMGGEPSGERTAARSIAVHARRVGQMQGSAGQRLSSGKSRLYDRTNTHTQCVE